MYKHSADLHDSPLAILSGKLDSTQPCWSTLENEGFAVLERLGRGQKFVSDSERFDFIMVYNNLIFIFNSFAVCSDLSHATLLKVLY